MILKGSQRGGGRDLAAHLMRADDNEHVRVHELRGFAADNLKDAFKEAEAISRGTKCRQYLFSLSLNPPQEAKVTEADFASAIERIEGRLGLTDQPRAIVVHEKENRLHMHCVWSRIDADTMTARPLPFFKQRLMEVSRNLYLDHGWRMPSGMIETGRRDPANFSLAEWQQAKRSGVDPRWLKEAASHCWHRSDSRKAFTHALRDHALFLARGDRRGFVVLDHEGELHSLPRLLGVKSKDVKARLGSGDHLPGVTEMRKEIGQRMSPAMRRHVQDAREAFRARSDQLFQYKLEMTRLHREARLKLEARQQLEWELETKTRAARLPSGLRGLWHRLTGEYQQVRAANEREAEVTRVRHAGERQLLIDKQKTQRTVLQTRFKELRGVQANALSSLRKDIGRYLALSRGRDPATRQGARQQALGLKLQR